MALSIGIPDGGVVLEAKPLTQEEFYQFGSVIENPKPDLRPSPNLQQLPPNAVLANQGSAIKYADVTKMIDLYGHAPSKSPSKPIITMFVSDPRALLPTANDGILGLFPVEILERHPFTTQTFIPLGLSPLENGNACYLIIVAPSLPPSQLDEQLPAPDSATGNPTLPGRGLPDLKKIRAFICKGSQGVTYAAGTWHAPMVAIGNKHIDFIVVQYANNVNIEDCQEVELREEQDGLGIKVAIPKELDRLVHVSKL
ncbi:hypothetical protein B7463_g5345, partial [Scytalidium lignicola]